VERLVPEAHARGVVERFAPTSERPVGTVRKEMRERIPSAFDLAHEFRARRNPLQRR
jgi:hypothetical protein